MHHIDVKDFSFEDSETPAEILYHGDATSYQIHFLEFEGFTCVFAVKSS
jgi:hypothetical protein